MMVPCNQDTPGAQHHAGKMNRSTYDITTGFVLARAASLVLQGGHVGFTKRDSRKMWRRATGGLPIPYLCQKYGYTKGISHLSEKQYMVEYKCGKCLRKKGCSDTRAKILNYSDYCRMCYRNHPGFESSGKHATSKEKKAACKTSAMGYPSCKEPI